MSIPVSAQDCHERCSAFYLWVNGHCWIWDPGQTFKVLDLCSYPVSCTSKGRSQGYKNTSLWMQVMGVASLVFPLPGMRAQCATPTIAFLLWAGYQSSGGYGTIALSLHLLFGGSLPSFCFDFNGSGGGFLLEHFLSSIFTELWWSWFLLRAVCGASG